jgi:hypothetical protein
MYYPRSLVHSAAGVTSEETLLSPDNKVHPDYYMVSEEGCAELKPTGGVVRTVEPCLCACIGNSHGYVLTLAPRVCLLSRRLLHNLQSQLSELLSVKEKAGVAV